MYRLITQASPMMLVYVGVWSNLSGKEQPKHPISRDEVAKLLITDKYGNVELTSAFMHHFLEKTCFQVILGSSYGIFENYRICLNYGKTKSTNFGNSIVFP